MRPELSRALPFQRLVIVLLILVFAAPFAVSWYLFHFTQIGRGGVDGSHGRLIVPPRPLPAAELLSPQGVQTGEVLRRRWTLVYLVPGRCASDCLAAMYRQRQLRLALGRHAHRVQRALVVYGEFPPHLPPEALREYAGQGVIAGSALDGDDPGRSFRLRDGDDPLAAGRLYVVDPMGNLMLAYPADADPAGIIDDLERLLRYSGAG
jgi:hypothetical protein